MAKLGYHQGQVEAKFGISNILQQWMWVSLGKQGFWAPTGAVYAIVMLQNLSTQPMQCQCNNLEPIGYCLRNTKQQHWRPKMWATFFHIWKFNMFGFFSGKTQHKIHWWNKAPCAQCSVQGSLLLYALRCSLRGEAGWAVGGRRMSWSQQPLLSFSQFRNWGLVFSPKSLVAFSFEALENE